MPAGSRFTTGSPTPTRIAPCVLRMARNHPRPKRAEGADLQSSTQNRLLNGVDAGRRPGVERVAAIATEKPPESDPAKSAGWRMEPQALAAGG